MKNLSNDFQIPIRYFGAKSRFIEQILERFPQNYHKYNYVDVFGGGGSVLLLKYPSEVEVYNDLNAELTNFFEVVRDDCLGLVKRSRVAFDNQVLFNHYWQDYDEDKLESLSNEERAWRYWYINLYSFSGMNDSWHGLINFHRDQNFLPGEIENPRETNFSVTVHKDYYKQVGRLFRMSSRMRGVQVTNYDFEYLINKLDAPNVLFYLDPPYLTGGETYARMYGYPKATQPFKVEHHQKLAKLMKNMKGKFVLSIDGADPKVDEIYMIDDRFQKFVFDVKYQTHAEGDKNAKECVITNFSEFMGACSY